MNGVSKKLCTSAAGIAAIVAMSADPGKLYFAIIIGTVCIVATLVQGYLDLQHPYRKERE